MEPVPTAVSLGRLVALRHGASSPPPVERPLFGGHEAAGGVSVLLVSALASGSSAVALGAVSAARRREAQRSRRTAGCLSSSDRLLSDSLHKEAAKLKEGLRRQADLTPVDTWRRRQQPRSLGGGRSWFSSLPSFSFGGLTASSSEAPLLARVLAAACWLPPLLACLPFGYGVLKHSPFLRLVLLRPLLPLLRPWMAWRYSQLFFTVLLYAVIGKNKSLHSLPRTCGLQASTLMMMLFPLNFVLQILENFPPAVGNFAQGVVFFYILYCCALAGGGGLFAGSVADLPGIGDGTLLAARAAMPRGGGRSFRGGG